jgi:rare lipoprotein A
VSVARALQLAAAFARASARGLRQLFAFARVLMQRSSPHLRAFGRALLRGLARLGRFAMAVLRWLRPQLLALARAALRGLRRLPGFVRALIRRLPPQQTAQAFGLGALLVTLWSCCPAQPPERERAAESSGGERTEGQRRGSVMRGDASYYAAFFRGRKTANGERYDPRKFTAANRWLPLGTRLRVTRVDTGKSVVVRVNDRGPFGRRDRILDLSRAAAEELDMIKVGHTQVEAVVLE